MSLVVKSKEINCRWCHKYAQLQYAQPKREGSLPSFLEGQIYSPGKTSITSLCWPCSAVPAWDNHRTLQRQPHGKIVTSLEWHPTTPSTAKARCQTDNKEAFQEVVQKLPFQPCPELGHKHQLFRKQKDAGFFHYCNINKLLLEQQELKTPNFLQTWVWFFCLLLPPIVLTEVTLAHLFYFHLTGDSTSPSQSSTVIFECQPVLQNHNKQELTVTERMWGGVSYSLPILIVLQLQLFLTRFILFKPGWNWPVAWKLPGKKEQLQKLWLPTTVQCFLAVKIIYTITFNFG